MQLIGFILFILYAHQVSAHEYTEAHSHESEGILRTKTCDSALKEWLLNFEILTQKHNEYIDRGKKVLDRLDELEESENNWDLIYWTKIIILYYEMKIIKYQINKAMDELRKEYKARKVIKETVCSENKEYVK